MADNEHEIHVGADMQHVTTPLDAKTIIVDGVKGVAVTRGLVRISFTENVLDTSGGEGQGQIKGRHVLNIAAEHNSFIAIMELLQKVLDRVKSTEQSSGQASQ